MKVIVTTSHGTQYHLDPDKLTWERKSSNELRWTDRTVGPTAGELAVFPEIFIGESMHLLILELGGVETPIRTSVVTNFENVEE